MKKIFALLLVLFTIFLSQSPMVIEAQPNETQLDQELHATDRIYLPLINKTDRPPRERTILRYCFIFAYFRKVQSMRVLYSSYS